MFSPLALTVSLFTSLTLSSSHAFVLPASKTPNSLLTPLSTTTLYAKRGRRSDDYYNDDEDYYNDNDNDNDNADDESEYEEYNPPRRRRRKNTRTDLSQDSSTTPFGTPKGIKLPDSVSQALLAGVFVLGIGTGVTVDSQINTSPKDLASRDAVDQAAPNPRLCSQYGASAMAFDQRVFVSFNPFNVYVAQADVKPACVLRSSNVVPVLQDKGLINDKEVRSCKQNMNTWAFVGDLNDYPQLSCVYRSEDAQNEFLSNPKYGIGEDVWDDDRAAIEAARSSGGGSNNKKKVKNEMTEGERSVATQAARLRKDAAVELDKSSISM